MRGLPVEHRCLEEPTCVGHLHRIRPAPVISDTQKVAGTSCRHPHASSRLRIPCDLDCRKGGNGLRGSRSCSPLLSQLEKALLEVVQRHFAARYLVVAEADFAVLRHDQETSLH